MRIKEKNNLLWFLVIGIMMVVFVFWLISFLNSKKEESKNSLWLGFQEIFNNYYPQVRELFYESSKNFPGITNKKEETTLISLPQNQSLSDSEYLTGPTNQQLEKLKEKILEQVKSFENSTE